MTRSRHDQYVSHLEPGIPFLGSVARADGRVTAYGLRARGLRLFPDVYASAESPVAPAELVRAAVLWAPPDGLACGMAAALLHGERWYAAEVVGRQLDVYTTGTPRAPAGIRLRRLRQPLPPEQTIVLHGVRTTSAARTAIDVARWDADDDRAIAKIDAVCNRSRTAVDTVRALAFDLRGAHGLQRVRRLLRSCDGRADSPPETRLRLLIGRSELPDPDLQLVIRNEFGVRIAKADLAYEREKVAIFYDGAGHRDKSTWEHDARVNAELAELGWAVIRVTGQMLRNPAVVLRQIAAALGRGRVAP